MRSFPVSLTRTVPLSFWLFLTGLIFFPLAFGTVELWSMTHAQVFILGGLFFYLLALYHSEAAKLYMPPGAAALLCFCGYIFLQTIPLPPFLLKVLSPRAAEIYGQTVWVAAPDAWLSLSLARHATLSEFFRYSCCAAFYFLTVQLLSRKEYLKKTVYVVVTVGAVIAFGAILQKISSPHAIYGVREVTQGTPMGPWVYRNHYAGFMIMLLPLIVALFLLNRPTVRYSSTWWQRLADFFAMPEANVHILLGLAALLVGVSVFLSLSRGGIVCMCLSLLIFILLVAQGRYGKKNQIVIAVLALLAVLAVCWFGWQQIMERFDAILGEDGQIRDARPRVWRDSLAIIADFPVSGAGFGSFVDVYRGYKGIGGHTLYQHAHNDYLELLTDGGLIGFLFFAWFMFSLFRVTLGTLRARRDHYHILLCYGALAGVVAFLLHGLTDFNLHNGANAFYFFFYCGLMVSAASNRRFFKRRPSYLPVTYSPIIRYTSGAAGLLLFASLLFNTGQLRARYLHAQLGDFAAGKADDQQLAVREATLSKIVAAAANDPGYRFELAHVRDLRGKREQAGQGYLRAVQLNPLNCRYTQWLAYQLAGVDAGKSDVLYRASLAFNPRKVSCIRNYANVLFYTGRDREATGVLTNALRLEPGDTKYYLPLLDRYHLSVDEVLRALPGNMESYVQYAEFLWDKGEKQQAVSVYEKGLQFLTPAEPVSPRYFSRGYNWYRVMDMEDRALDLLRQAVRVLPAHAGFHEQLGDLYQRRGIAYRALEEYDKVLALNPKNERVKRKSEQLRGE